MKSLGQVNPVAVPHIRLECPLKMIDCLFLWLSWSLQWMGQSPEENQTFSKIHLNVNIFLSLVLFPSDPLAQNYAYLIGSVHNQMTFFTSLGWHPFKMNRKNIEALEREWLFFKTKTIFTEIIFWSKVNKADYIFACV